MKMKKKVQVTIIEKNSGKKTDASVEVIGTTKWTSTEPKIAEPRKIEPKTTKPRTTERKLPEPQTTQTRYRKDEKNLGEKHTGAATK